MTFARGSVATTAFLLLFCGASCGTAERNDEGGGEAPDECMVFSPCGFVLIADVNSMCGINAMLTSSVSVTSADPSRLPVTNDCRYDGTPGVQVEHRCYSSESLASSSFAQEQALLTGNETQVNVTGIGEQAFLREHVPYMTTQLFVLQANVIVVAAMSATGGGQAAQQCLDAVARKALVIP